MLENINVNIYVKLLRDVIKRIDIKFIIFIQQQIMRKMKKNLINIIYSNFRSKEKVQ